jgi:hypothetical protein
MSYSYAGLWKRYSLVQVPSIVASKSRKHYRSSPSIANHTYDLRLRVNTIQYSHWTPNLMQKRNLIGICTAHSAQCLSALGRISVSKFAIRYRLDIFGMCCHYAKRVCIIVLIKSACTFWWYQPTDVFVENKRYNALCIQHVCLLYSISHR